MQRVALLVVIAVGLAPGRVEAQKDPLSRARALYNQGQYGAAIEQAQRARRVDGQVDAASVVLARAHLERFRDQLAEQDLLEAREALKHADPAKLAPRDRVEFTIGLGETLYFEGRYGAAAELFDDALAHAEVLGADARERLFDWWAGALDRQAQAAHELDRAIVYAKMLRRAEDEVRRDGGAMAASYWLAAAARGVDDLDRAWQLAMAGWVRARVAGSRADALRGDLDRLVLEVIAPERAWHRTPKGDAQPAIALMRAEWEDFKQKWSAPLPAARPMPPLSPRVAARTRSS